MALFASKDPELPLPPKPQPPRRTPEHYARAMQDFHEIQSELAQIQSERDQLRINIEVESKENARLRAEIRDLKEKVDVYHDRIASIEARFDDAAAIILRVIDSRLTTRPASPTPPISIERLSEDMEAEKSER